MVQIDALQKARAEWPQGLPFIRPHVRAPVLVRRGDSVDYVAARFGMSRKFTSFNARDDSLEKSPLWRKFFGTSHAIAPLSYVVEWVTEAGTKQPFVIERADGKLLLAPALVGPYIDDSRETGFAICTRPPNRFFAHFHDRMIGVCPADLMDAWLDPSAHTREELRACVAAPGDDELVAYPAPLDLQKRKAGDWSPIRTLDGPLRLADLERPRTDPRGPPGG